MDRLKPTFCDNPSSATNEDIFNELDNWTDSQISKETKKLLSEGDKIVSHMAKLAKKDPEEYGEKYATMLKEREELQSVTVKAFCNDRKILKDELLDLKKEFDDIHKLSERYRDKLKRWYDHFASEVAEESEEYVNDVVRWFSHIGNEIREESEEFSQDTKRWFQHIGNEIEEETGKLKVWVKDFIENEKKIDRRKKVKEYWLEDGMIALNHTQKDYILQNAPWRAGNTNQIIEIQANNERDVFQRRLIEHLFETHPELSKHKMRTYDTKTWYRLINNEAFEEDFIEVDINKIDIKALSLYLAFLESKYEDEAQNVFLNRHKEIDFDADNGQAIEDFLDKGSLWIDTVNKLRRRKWVRNDLQKWMWELDIEDPFLKESIKQEINRIGSIKWIINWEWKDYSLLLLSVLFKKAKRPLVMRNLPAHEEVQRNMINKLNANWANLIIAHTEELSYYPIKVKDYNQKILETKDIRNLNPLGLANYLDYLDSKWEWINTLFSRLPFNKLEDLQDILGKDWSGEVAQILKSRWLSYITNIITNFSPNNTEVSIIESIDKLETEEEQKVALTYIKKNINELKSKLWVDIQKFLIKKYPEHSQEQVNERMEEVMIIIEKLITENADLETIIWTINDLGMDVDLKPTTKSITELQMQTQAQIIIESERRAAEAEASWDTKAAEAERMNIETAKANLNQAGMNAVVAKAMNSEEYQQVASWEKTMTKVIEGIKARDEDFAKKMERFEEKETLVLLKPEIIETGIQQAFASERTTEWTYTIETPQGEKIEWLTQTEFQEVSKSKEARDNLVDMKHILEESNLDYFWENRDIIFTAIGNMNTLWFDTTDWNYVNPAELKFILAMVVGSVKDELWEQYEARVLSLENTWSLPEAINLVKDINWESWVLSTEDVNHFWDSKITKLFIDKFIPRESSQVFNHSKFQESF